VKLALFLKLIKKTKIFFGLVSKKLSYARYKLIERGDSYLDCFAAYGWER